MEDQIDFTPRKIEKLPEEPPKENIYKTRKQKVIEERKDFVPIINPKQTTEVIVKPKPSIEEIQTIEKIGRKASPEEKIKFRKGKKEPKVSKEKKAKRTEQVAHRAPKIEVLEGNSILIITEKPQAALKIANALSEGKARKYSDSGVPYYEFDRNNEHVIVACAVGHLFSLSQDIKGSDYPIFEVSWKPNFEVRKRDFTRKYYSNLKKLVKRAREIIVATDYDIEGETIGYNIIRFIGNQKDAKRMKFSSLTVDELNDAYTKLSSTIDWGQAIAGETRHFIDWYYGINLSRALMKSIQTTGKFRIMSIGRVQGPALKLIVEKEREIMAFKPVPYWKIFIEVIDKKDKTNIAKLRHVKDIFNESELPRFEKLKNKEADVITEKHEQKIIPPHPFDLTTLQTEAYRFFSINPARTLEIAQQLYLAGIISYPRTSSQKIPSTIDPKKILKKLAKYYSEVKFATRVNPVEGKKSDPAHPSIYPTGDFQTMEGEERKIYELIVKRFISCFCEDALVENKTITAVSDNLVFKDRGVGIRVKGWMEVYTPSLKEKELRDMNGRADITKVEIEKDETKPPRRFSPASIISELEKRGLGTKATRSAIIETLYSRNYIADNKAIRATPLGINLITTLEKYSPIIIDEKLTKSMEKDMEGIQTSKKDLDKKQTAILQKAQATLKDISVDFKKKETEVGRELIQAEQENWAQQNSENELSQCPLCKKGNLTIKYSPKNKKHFVACTNYPACKQTFSLPPFGMIKRFDKVCDKCGFPLLMCLRKAKRPWIFCFNPQCPTRQEGYVQKSEDNKSEEENSSKEESEESNVEQ